MEYKVPLNLHNRYDIEVRDARTGKLKQRAQAENIVLDALWARLLNVETQAYGTYINFGTGTGTLSAARTTMFTHLGYKVGLSETFARADTYISRRISIQLLENEFVDSVLREVSLSAGSTAIYTHALLKDMNGNPVAITKKDTDIITIYATVYLVFPSAGWYSGSVFIPQVIAAGQLPSALFRRLLGANSPIASEDLAYLSGGKQAHRVSAQLHSLAPTTSFDVANKKVSYYGRVPAANSNVASGIGAVILRDTASLGTGSVKSLFLRDTGEWHGLQTIIGEAIGTGDGVTTDFYTAFPFVQAGATFKADGVAAPASILNMPPRINDISPFMVIAAGMVEKNCTVNADFAGVADAPDGFWENPWWETVGLESLTLIGALYTSDDNANWTLAVSRMIASPGGASIPAGHQHKRYWKGSPNVISGTNKMFRATDWTTPDAVNLKNVRFATPPAVGVVLTADYQTTVIPKDVNHVYDLTVVLQLAEYTP